MNCLKTKILQWYRSKSRYHPDGELIRERQCEGWSPWYCLWSPPNCIASDLPTWQGSKTGNLKPCPSPPTVGLIICPLFVNPVLTHCPFSSPVVHKGRPNSKGHHLEVKPNPDPRGTNKRRHHSPHELAVPVTWLPGRSSWLARGNQTKSGGNETWTHLMSRLHAIQQITLILSGIIAHPQFKVKKWTTNRHHCHSFVGQINAKCSPSWICLATWRASPGKMHWWSGLEAAWAPTSAPGNHKKCQCASPGHGVKIPDARSVTLRATSEDMWMAKA